MFVYFFFLQVGLMYGLFPIHYSIRLVSTNFPSPRLLNQLQCLNNPLRKEGSWTFFLDVSPEPPWIFQKCSNSRIYMVCFSARILQGLAPTVRSCIRPDWEVLQPFQVTTLQMSILFLQIASGITFPNGRCNLSMSLNGLKYSMVSWIAVQLKWYNNWGLPWCKTRHYSYKF